MKFEDEQVYALATRNRLLAASMFAGLTEEQWRTPSLCAGWTVREVCAHLIPPQGGFTVLSLVWDVIRFRGDLARMVDSTAREGARRPTAELVGSLRERAGERLKAPVVGPHGPMVDTAIHLRDAARPLGLDTCPRYLLCSPFFDEDVGVLAGRPRHDCCPQSLMIRGVMSPGPEGAGDIADRGRAEVVEAVCNVDAEL